MIFLHYESCPSEPYSSLFIQIQHEVNTYPFSNYDRDCLSLKVNPVYNSLCQASRAYNMKLLASVVPGLIAYQGQSYNDYGVLHLTINGGRVGRILRNFTENYELDWLEPHAGPTYYAGTRVSILAKDGVLSELSDVLTSNTNIKFNVTNGLDKEIENSMTNTKGTIDCCLIVKITYIRSKFERQRRQLCFQQVSYSG